MTDDQNFGEELGEALRHRADQTGLVPASIGEVQRRARRIHRRRQAVAVVGAAATVGVLAGIGVALIPGSGDHGAPTPTTTTRTPTASPSRTAATPLPATRSPAPTGRTASPSGSHGKPTYTVDLTPTSQEGTTDGEPMVPQWMDGTITDAHGTPTQVGRRLYSFAQLPSGGWIGTAYAGGRWSVVTTDTKGTVTAEDDAPGEGIGVTPDGRSVAWFTRPAGTSGDWTLHLVGAHARTWKIGGGPTGVVGILSNGDVVYNVAGGVEIAHQDGSTSALKGALTASSVATATNEIAVETGEASGCWTILDADSTQRHQATCGITGLGQFSADGTMIGGTLTSNSLGPTKLFMMKTDGSEVTTFAAPPGGDFSTAWTWSGSSIIVPTYDGGQWGLAWLSAGGVTTQRGVHTPSSDAQVPPYYFGAGPLTAP